MLKLVKEKQEWKNWRNTSNKERHSEDESVVQILWGGHERPLRFLVGSMLEAEYTLVCGFPKAEQIQPGPSRSHRHIGFYTHTQREGELGFSCSCGKKEGRGKGRMSGGNLSRWGGPLLGPKSFYSASWISHALAHSQTRMTERDTWGEATCADASCWGGVWTLLKPLPAFDHSYVTRQWVSG